MPLSSCCPGRSLACCLRTLLILVFSKMSIPCLVLSTAGDVFQSHLQSFLLWLLNLILFFLLNRLSLLLLRLRRGLCSSRLLHRSSLHIFFGSLCWWSSSNTCTSQPFFYYLCPPKPLLKHDQKQWQQDFLPAVAWTSAPGSLSP